MDDDEVTWHDASRGQRFGILALVVVAVVVLLVGVGSVVVVFGGNGSQRPAADSAALPADAGSATPSAEPEPPSPPRP